MINTIQHPCGIERKQSLTSNSQARASCAQAAGRAGPGLLAAPTPPCARGWGQADAAP